MDTVKTTVLTACTAGLISCILRSSTLGTGGRKLMRMMVNLIVLISLVKPLLSSDFSDAVNDLQALQLDSRTGITDDLTEFYIATAELSTSTELDKYLTSNGYKDVKTVISCEIDEYDDIKVKKAEFIISAEDDPQKIRDLVIGLLPEAEIIVTEADDAEKRSEETYKNPL